MYWPMLKEWVTEESLIIVTLVIVAASGVWTVKDCSYATLKGADVTVGLAPLKRYGGE